MTAATLDNNGSHEPLLMIIMMKNKTVLVCYQDFKLKVLVQSFSSKIEFKNTTTKAIRWSI